MKHRLIQGNCLKIMAEMPDDSVDLIFGSPPYENARDLKEDPFPVLKGQHWVDWMVEVYLASLRVSTGLVAYVVQGRTRNFRWAATPALLISELYKKGVCLRNPPLYVRHGIPGSGGPDWLKSRYEWIVCATSGGRLPWSRNTACGHPPIYKAGGAMTNRKQDGDRCFNVQTHRKLNGSRSRTSGKRPMPKLSNPGNLIDCGANTHFGLGGKNEAPFPKKLAEFMIRSFCPPNGTVLDPFCGSGTTCAVAKKEGRGYIGIDIRKSQVILSKVRLTKIK